MSRTRRVPLSPLAAAFFAALALGASAAERDEVHAAAKDLADLTLEQLANVVVTSPSRRAERLIDVPASLFVITAEDIRRSGVTSIPEALRLAPNLNVARADNNQYAISARGLNNLLANKMLVMIDGRTVYTPLFSGVFWDAQDVILEDIERIEVISGPATAIWGTNAVNGVINIITAGAGKTQGTVIAAGGGDRERGVAARHGMRLGTDAHLRIYAKYFDRDPQKLESGAEIRDESERAMAGLRFDWARPGDRVTVQAEAYRGTLDQVPAGRDLSGAHVLARWNRELGAGSSVRLQGYYDRTEREHRASFAETLDVFDVEFQNALAERGGHRIQWGAGVRHARDDVTNTPSQAFEPPRRTLNWSNLFVQDTFALRPDMAVTLGMKAERNPYTGMEFLPTGRVAWQFANEQLLWGSLSRAVRAPSRIDREFFSPGTPPFRLVANPNFGSEVSNVAEVGYRGQITPRFSLSATAFHHRHQDLRSIEPFEGMFRLANDIEGRTTGVEGWATFRASPTWRLSLGLVEMRQRLRVDEGRVDLGGMAALGNDPRRHALLRSSWNFGSDWEADLIVRHTGELPNPLVPAYTTANARVAWTPRRGLEFSLAARSLVGDDHPEWGVPGNRAEFDRGFFFMVRWTS